MAHPSPAGQTSALAKCPCKDVQSILKVKHGFYSSIASRPFSLSLSTKSRVCGVWACMAAVSGWLVKQGFCIGVGCLKVAALLHKCVLFESAIISFLFKKASGCFKLFKIYFLAGC